MRLAVLLLLVVLLLVVVISQAGKEGWARRVLLRCICDVTSRQTSPRTLVYHYYSVLIIKPLVAHYDGTI